MQILEVATFKQVKTNNVFLFIELLCAKWEAGFTDLQIVFKSLNLRKPNCRTFAKLLAARPSRAQPPRPTSSTAPPSTAPPHAVRPSTAGPGPPQSHPPGACSQRPNPEPPMGHALHSSSTARPSTAPTLHIPRFSRPDSPRPDFPQADPPRPNPPRPKRLEQKWQRFSPSSYMYETGVTCCAKSVDRT